MGMSRLSSKCRSCRYGESCEHKEMEAFAYIDEETAQSATMPIVQPILKESEMINVTTTAVGIHTPNQGTICVDRKQFEEEINKALHKELFMPLC